MYSLPFQMIGMDWVPPSFTSDIHAFSDVLSNIPSEPMEKERIVSVFPFLASGSITSLSVTLLNAMNTLPS